jgi:phosphonate transport system permease protein
MNQEFNHPRYQLPASLMGFIGLVAIALLCINFADLSIITRTPWQEFERMLEGILSPRLIPLQELNTALLKTVAFAMSAVIISAVLGFGLSLLFKYRSIRWFCALIRAVHELFWGLLFILVLGLHPLAGILAIAIPFSGIFAKVFAEILEEAEQQAPASIPMSTDALSYFLYARWPIVKPHFVTYTLYRLECGLRSSTVLGFIGLPTLGFYLESGFMQGDYSQVAGLLLLFYLLIASIRHWAKLQLLPIYFIICITYLWQDIHIDSALLRTLAADLKPAPLGNPAIDFYPWLANLVSHEIIPGIINTLLVSQIALVVSGLLALLLFPLISEQFTNRYQRTLGHLLLVVLRSTPELIIAFVLLLLWGPSMLPAIVALAIHNGAIVGHLVGRFSNTIELRRDASKGLNRYSYEILPRVYRQFLAFLCYRWETIMRESAILGLLGIHTLGFFIDSAFESFRLDIAMILILATALMNIAVDSFSRWFRRRLHLHTSPIARTPC